LDLGGDSDGGGGKVDKKSTRPVWKKPEWN
jgi:hypothetical protein